MATLQIDRAEAQEPMPQNPTNPRSTSPDSNPSHEPVGSDHDGDPGPAGVTQLLRGEIPSPTDAAQVDAAADRLLGQVYDELHALAAQRMQAEHRGHTLQATALVHEAYVKLAGQEYRGWENRRHFYAAASEAMRRILVDHARKSKTQKRGGGDAQQVTLGAAEAAVDIGLERYLDVDAAFERLGREDPEAAEVTRMRFYGGMSVEETAASLGLSVRTVHRRWIYARARLFELLGEAEATN